MWRVPVLLVIVHLLGCDRRRTPGGLVAAASGSASLAPVPASAATVSTVLSEAIFSADNVLTMCFDNDVRSNLDGGKWTAKERAAAAERMAAVDAGLSGGSGVSIDKTCTEAFGDRIELASCTQPGGVLFHYYSFALLENDLEMKSCLKDLRGSWKALPQDSDQYRLAHARYEAEKAQKALERMQHGRWRVRGATNGEWVRHDEAGGEEPRCQSPQPARRPRRAERLGDALPTPAPCRGRSDLDGAPRTTAAPGSSAFSPGDVARLTDAA